MGYRSEVAFHAKVHDPEGFAALIRLTFADNERVNYLLESIRYDESGVYFYSDWIKWYDEEQRFYDGLLNLGSEFDPKFAIRFLRIGEDLTDLEDATYGDLDSMNVEVDDMRISCQMNLPRDFTTIGKPIKEKSDD